MSDERRHRHNVPSARRLRREATLSERMLWEVVRDRRFRGLKFRRQHPVGPFVLDFYCEALQLGFEIDGGVHRRPAQAARDRARERILEELGIRVIRLPAETVEADPVGALERAMRPLTPGPSPTSRERGDRTWERVTAGPHTVTRGIGE